MTLLTSLMKIQISFQQLTKLFPESKISGTSDVKEYSGISSLERANTGDISFLGNSKYKELVPKSKASLILLPQNYSGEPNHNQVYLYSDSPSEALAKLCKLLEDKLFHKQAPEYIPLHGLTHLHALAEMFLLGHLVL